MYMVESIFSKSVKAGGTTYFFDVQQAKGGNQSKYVRVTSSRLQNGQPFRSSTTIFPEQLKPFVEAFQEATEQVE